MLLNFWGMTDFQNQLLGLRKARGWSQQRLADQVQCSKMHISALERGICELSLPMMRRLATVLSVSPAELLSPVDNPHALSPAEQQLILTFRGCAAEKQQDILRVINALAGPLQQDADST